VPRDLAAQAEEFRELLLDACRLRLRCDVGVATSLSGGLDSSSVLCALAAAQERPGAVRQPPEWRRAFVAGFTGTSQDEAEHAALAAEHAGAIRVVRQLSGEDLAAHVDDYLYQFEEIGGLFGAAAWLLYREMRRAGIAVSLDGHGGDELLGGYDYYVMLAMMRGRGVLLEPGRTLDLIDILRQLQGAGRGGSPPSRAVLAALTIPGAPLRRGFRACGTCREATHPSCGVTPSIRAPRPIRRSTRRSGRSTPSDH
jgi:asparagine synthetase B (glutamine-hydrolysing)